MSMYGESSRRPVVVCGPGRTKQSFRAQTDINNIVARYQKTGLLEHVRVNPGVFADVSEIGDYHGMVAKIRFAQERFEQLPAVIRARFNGDPGLLVRFMSDEANRDEAVKLGLIGKPSVKPVVAPKSVVDAVRVIDVHPPGVAPVEPGKVAPEVEPSV